MPEIGDDQPVIGKTQTTGFWKSQLCDNSLAMFPLNIDPSWGIKSFDLDGVDENNYIIIHILDETDSTLKSFKITSKGTKKIDLSQVSEIDSNQDIKIMFEVVTWI